MALDKNLEKIIEIYKLHVKRNKKSKIITFNDRMFISKDFFDFIYDEKVVKYKEKLYDWWILEEDEYETVPALLYFVLGYSALLFVGSGLGFAFISLLIAALLEDLSLMVKMTFIPSVTIVLIQGWFILKYGLYVIKNEKFEIEDYSRLRESLSKNNIHDYMDVTIEPKLLAYILKNRYIEKGDVNFESKQTIKENSFHPYFLDLNEAIENYDKLNIRTKSLVAENLELIAKKNNIKKFSELNNIIDINMATLNKIL